MAINIPPQPPQSDFPELPVGSYQAVVSGIWDIGVQKNEFNGEVKFKQQVIVRFEINKAIPSGKYEGDRYTINSWINLPESFDDRSTFIKLRNAAEARATVATDYINYNEQGLIGKNVILNVEHTKKGKPKIGSIGSIMEGMALIQPLLSSEMPEWVGKQKEKAVSGGGGTQAPVQPQQDIPPIEAYTQAPPALGDDLPY